jgi:hypothetical protein
MYRPLEPRRGLSGDLGLPGPRLVLAIRGESVGGGGLKGVGIYCQSARIPRSSMWLRRPLIYLTIGRTYRVRLRLEVANLIRFSFERNPWESGRTAAIIERRYKYVLRVYWTHFCTSAMISMKNRLDYLPRLYHDLLKYPLF